MSSRVGLDDCGLCKWLKIKAEEKRSAQVHYETVKLIREHVARFHPDMLPKEAFHGLWRLPG